MVSQAKEGEVLSTEELSGKQQLLPQMYTNALFSKIVQQLHKCIEFAAVNMMGNSASSQLGMKLFCLLPRVYTQMTETRPTKK